MHDRVLQAIIARKNAVNEDIAFLQKEWLLLEKELFQNSLKQNIAHSSLFETYIDVLKTDVSLYVSLLKDRNNE